MASLASLARAYRLRSAFEVRLLRTSILATLAIAGIGIVLGIVADSVAIIFDGLFSLIDAAITVLMLAVARLVASEGSRRFQYGFWHLLPFVDPVVLALLSLALLPIPLSEVRRAFGEIFVEAPRELDEEVRNVMSAFVTCHGFERFASYVSKAGRAKFIEVSVLVPPSYPPHTVAHFDALRAEIGAALGDGGPERWLTIVFTSNRSQL